MDMDDFVKNYLEDFDETATKMTRLDRIHHSGQRKLWRIGHSCVVSEIPYNGPNKETPFDQKAIYDFLKQYTSIPVPEIHREWEEEDEDARDDREMHVSEQQAPQREKMRWHYCLRQFIPGQTLEDAWSSMSAAQQIKATEEVCEILQQLRRLTTPYMGRINKQPLVDHVLFNTLHFDRHGPFRSDAALFQAMFKALVEYNKSRGSFLTPKVFYALWSLMPSCKPYTFTHGDLSWSNIIWDSNQNRVVALLDWEWSGFFPRWWEHAKFRWGCEKNRVDSGWYQMLEPHLREDSHPAHVNSHPVQTESPTSQAGTRPSPPAPPSPVVQGHIEGAGHDCDEMDISDDEGSYTDGDDDADNTCDDDSDDSFEEMDSGPGHLTDDIHTHSAVFMDFYQKLIRFVAAEENYEKHKNLILEGQEAVLRLEIIYDQLDREGKVREFRN